MVRDLLETPYSFERVHRAGEFGLYRFLPPFRWDGREQHIGEPITDHRSRTAYLKTFRPSEKQVGKGCRPHRLADRDRHPGETAGALGTTYAEPARRIGAAGSGRAPGRARRRTEGAGGPSNTGFTNGQPAGNPVLRSCGPKAVVRSGPGRVRAETAASRSAASRRGQPLPPPPGAGGNPSSTPRALRMSPVTFKAEYIWIDGTEPTAKLRSKTKIIVGGSAALDELPIWGFDGSSTNQAKGHASDRVLKPVFVCPDPIRGGDDVLVLCEVLNTDMTPHESNTRAALAEVAGKYAAQEPIFGIEQEYTFFKGSRPLGFPEAGFPAAQGGYYCGVGADEIFGRDVVEAHLENCLTAGLGISGINAEVMPGQWEFQVGPLAPLEVSDQLWIARWLLYRTAEDFDVSATLDPKPVKGDWNGAGAHTNFSTKAMREGYDAIVTACESLGEGSKPLDHVKNYGAGIDERLTGLHETAPWDEYSYGVSDRGASVRIPWQVEQDRKGYIEDRRPNANVDPYVVTRLLVDTCCEALEKAGQV